MGPLSDPNHILWPLSSLMLEAGSWEEVARLRAEAEKQALVGDDLAAALLDRQASQMANELNTQEVAARERCGTQRR